MTNIASPSLRILAALVDLLISFLLISLVLLALSSFVDLPGLLNSLLYFLVIIILGGTLLSLSYVFLTSRLGGSPGKLLLGLSVVDSAGHHISFRRAFFRNHIGYLVSGLLLWLGFVWIFIDPDGRAWHDQIADTYVVVVRRSGLYSGLFFLIVLIFLCCYLALSVFNQFSLHLPLFREIVSEAKSELAPMPTPTPTPVLPKKYISVSGKLEVYFPGDWHVQESIIQDNLANFQAFIKTGYSGSSPNQIQFEVQTRRPGSLNTTNLPGVEASMISDLNSQHAGYTFSEYSPPHLVSIDGRTGIRLDLVYSPQGQSLKIRRTDVIVDSGTWFYSFSAVYPAEDQILTAEIDSILQSIKFL